MTRRMLLLSAVGELLVLAFAVLWVTSCRTLFHPFGRCWQLTSVDANPPLAYTLRLPAEPPPQPKWRRVVVWCHEKPTFNDGLSRSVVGGDSPLPLPFSPTGVWCFDGAESYRYTDGRGFVQRWTPSLATHGAPSDPLLYCHRTTQRGFECAPTRPERAPPEGGDLID